MSKNIFCVDIGGSKLVCGAVTTDGEVIEAIRTEYPEQYSVATIRDLICDGYEQLKHYGFSACGVAVPGLCDYSKGQWLYSPFSGLGDILITQIVSEITKLPTIADNDVNVSALAEKYFGVCKDISDFLWITVSNGIGGGIYLNDSLYRGQGLSAGEIGHFIVQENGRKCGCGSRGCLEAYASGASIAAIYNEITGCNCTAKTIAERARDGDKNALSVWHSAGKYIGKAAAYAVNLLNINTVVLGGGAAEAFDLLEPSATKALGDNLFKKANPNVKILHSTPGRYAALIGCAALVLQKEKDYE
ncbi:MAG: ROK family protein [Clostridia bacterium]|nr:ROK family protein [Clostridia bacterium]